MAVFLEGRVLLLGEACSLFPAVGGTADSGPSGRLPQMCWFLHRAQFFLNFTRWTQVEQDCMGYNSELRI